MFSFYTLRVIIKTLTKISISTRLILIKKWLKVKWINILDIKKPPMRWFFYCAEINQQPVILVNYLVAFKVCALLALLTVLITGVLLKVAIIG
jgi:hypothetical protein